MHPLTDESRQVESFGALINAGFERGDTTGVCQFCIEGAAEPWFYVQVSDLSVSCRPGRHPDPTTTVTMPKALFSSIIARPHLWDMRNPEVITRVAVTGDVGMALFLGRIAKTPAQTGAMVFREAERKARDCVIGQGDIPRLERPSRQEVIRRIDEGTPLIITGVLAEEGAWTWSFERIREAFAHQHLDPGRQGETPRTLGQFFDEVEAGQESYTHGIAMPPAMRPYFRLSLFPEEAFNTPLLWMGRKSGMSGAEPCTALHRDTSHGFLGQVRGHKRILLCSPDQAEKVYPERAYNVFQSCAVKLWQPDFQRFPLSRGLRTIEVCIGPGEMLVTPAGWFHEVYCGEPVMSVTMFMHWSYWRSQVRNAIA
jgi:hypothetical protein